MLATAVFVTLSAFALVSHYGVPYANTGGSSPSNYSISKYAPSAKRNCLNNNAAIRRTGGTADDASCGGK